nr:ATP-dependent zinc metalloprotease FtsH [bacterium]
LLARAVAGEAGVPFFSISGSDFVEMFVGVGASRVRDMFEQGRRHAPCIIFLDEIDAVGRHRGAGLGGGHDEREQTLNQLLVEMDGFDTQEGVIMIAATNRPDVLDPALLRPGRFDRQIVIDLPDLEGRKQIIRVHAQKVVLAPDLDLDRIARGTPGFSGADLANLVNEAALLAARHGREAVDLEDLEEARDKVRWGRERRSRVMDEEDRKVTAYHEAGHALVLRLIPETEPLHKVTIIPRGIAYLGATMQLPEKDRYHEFRRRLTGELAGLFGGRVAEEAIFGDITAGARSDIKYATELARRMVCEWGMSEAMGPMTFGSREEHIFLGREVSRSVDYSEETAVKIDREVRRIIDEAYRHARRLVEENREALVAIAEALLKYEVIDGDDVDSLIKSGRVRRRPGGRRSRASRTAPGQPPPLPGAGGEKGKNRQPASPPASVPGGEDADGVVS